ncbi:MAG: DUF2634 domain-containing protein [Oscillospiraceae bacterium]|jgi:hypothetical protein|nr:DUF2634 domain-containing protein [Oscillospiraceae bacterium]DAJ51450.1 MAG TPA: Protein of unknown function (DUF2634) [Caudoviricetes sp.]
MIPSTTAFLEQDFELERQPTYTYKMNLESNLIRGYTDGLEAMKQAIFKILSTERYQYIMYSWNYGIETLDLYGEPVSYVCPELERRISEALLWDERITSVTDFEFNISKKRVVHVTFIAHTIFGDVQAEREVNF